MENQEIKNKIWESYFKVGKFNKRELCLYKKFFEKFDCKFRIKKTTPVDFNELHLYVKLKNKANNLEGIAKEIEEKGIKLGKEKNRCYVSPDYHSIEYENASLDKNDRRCRLNYTKIPTHATIILKK